jgi:hypothetical protein
MQRLLCAVEHEHLVRRAPDAARRGEISAIAMRSTASPAGSSSPRSTSPRRQRRAPSWAHRRRGNASYAGTPSSNGACGPSVRISVAPLVTSVRPRCDRRGADCGMRGAVCAMRDALLLREVATFRDWPPRARGTVSRASGITSRARVPPPRRPCR